MKKKENKLIKVGRTCVKDALGFFWHDHHKIFVAATPEDIVEWKSRGMENVHPMSELEDAFRESTALKFISWCKTGGIVPQGAKQVAFEYTTHKSVIHIK